jgi:hypothetical protein
VNEKLARNIILIIAIIILVSLFTPLAFPNVHEQMYIDSKEANSFVWIFGVCIGNGQLFFLTKYSAIIIYLSSLIVISSILSVAFAFRLKSKRENKVTFEEIFLIINFLIFPISNVIIISIEYNFAFFQNVPIMLFTRADFWSYHAPGLCYFGISLFPNLLMLISLILMHYHKSNFFSYSIILYLVNCVWMAYLFLYL